MTIWTFGDSYAEQYVGLNDQWMQRIANNLSTDVKPFGLVGTSTEYTYTKFNENRKDLKDSDIIIIALTTHSRRWFFKDYPSHSAYPAPGTDYKAPTVIYNPTGFDIINESLELYEECLNNRDVSKTYLENFLYNLDIITKTLNLHTIILINFFDTNYFLKDKKDWFPNLHFTNGMMLEISLDEYTKEYVLDCDTTVTDPRVNHMIKDNHIILSNKIIDNIKNKTPIDLTSGFVKHILNKERLTNQEFINDQLFNGILT